MAYFIPRFVQKRILRYVLSKLEILDTDALGLDNLDITIGQRSTFELRDIAINRAKVTSLLQLPDLIVLSSAKIDRLCVTIPADLYQSPVVIDIAGVGLIIDLVHGHEHSGNRSATPAGEASSRSNSRDTPPAPDYGLQHEQKHSRVMDAAPPRPPSRDSHKVLNNGLFDSTDLARSFLEEEDESRTNIMRHAIYESQGLAKPTSAMSEEDDSNADLGVGYELSLPTFLAGFLNGLVDRMQVSVRGIQIDLVLHDQVTLSKHGGSSSHESDNLRSLRLMIGCAKFETAQPMQSSSMQHSERDSITGSLEACRQITLSDIHCLLISDLSLPSRTSPSSDSPSSNTISSSPSSTPKTGARRNGRAHSADSEITPAIFANRGISLVYAASELATGEPSLHSGHVHEDEDESPRFIQSVQPYRYPSQFTSERDRTNRLTPDRVPESVEARSSFSSESPADSQLDDTSKTRSKSGSSPREGGVPPAPGLEQSNHPALQQNHPVPQPAVEDLTESRLYTHNEAVSLYTSAVDQTFGLQSARMPGGWTSTLEPMEQAAIDQVTPPVATDQGTSSDYLLKPDWSIADSRGKMGRPDAMQVQSALELQPSSVDVQDHNLSSDPNSTIPVADYPSQISTTQESSITAKVLLSVSKIRVQYLANGSTQRLAGTPPSSHSMSDEAKGHNPKTQAESSALTTINAKIFPLHVIFDMTNLRILSNVLGQVLSYFEERPTKHQAYKSHSALKIKFECEELLIKFVESVKSHALEEVPSFKSFRDFSDAKIASEILLQAKMGGIEASLADNQDIKTYQLSLCSSSFGYKNLDILAFDRARPIMVSGRGSPATVDADVFLHVKTSTAHGDAFVELFTRPLDVLVDLQRLDDTFAWLGGLSSILELTSSLSSTVRAGGTHDNKKPLPKKAKVHFQSSDGKSPPGVTPPSQLFKLNVRLGGISMSLQGQHSSLGIESSAIKIVRRNQGLGVQIDRVKVMGPCLPSPSFGTNYVNLKNIRLEYMMTPKEVDLAKLLDLVDSSKLLNEKEAEDVLMIDTLLRQRRQGSVLRVTIDRATGELCDLSSLHLLMGLVFEMKKLGAVTKYLPEDDRPGLLLLALIRNVALKATVDQPKATSELGCCDFEIALVTFPYLVALRTKSIALSHDSRAAGCGPIPSTIISSGQNSPVMWARFIGNEPVPILRIRMQDIQCEYYVSLITAVSAYKASLSQSTLLSDLASSILTVTGHRSVPSLGSSHDTMQRSEVGRGEVDARAPEMDVVVRNALLGLNPRDGTGKAYVVLEEVHISNALRASSITTSLVINRTSLMLIDSQHTETASEVPKHTTLNVDHLATLGYSTIATLFSPSFDLKTTRENLGAEPQIDITMTGGFLLIESCADSTQTLQDIIKQLMPQATGEPPLKYRMEAVSIVDMLDSLSGDAYNTADKPGEEDVVPLKPESSHHSENSIHEDDDCAAEMSDYVYDGSSEILSSSLLEDDFEDMSKSAALFEAEAHESRTQPDQEPLAEAALSLSFHNEHFGSGTKKSEDFEEDRKSLSIAVQGFHIIWNLFDGYDWAETRQKISQAVSDVQAKVKEQRSQKRKSKGTERQQPEEDIVGDFLFNSIYIGIPRSADPLDLPHRVNTGIETTQIGNATREVRSHEPDQEQKIDSNFRKGDSLRLGRSRTHKMTFELKGISGNLLHYSQLTRQLQSITELEIQDFEIFDHLPSSTWKKFATYMRDAGDREDDLPMIRINLSEVRPVPDLMATEMILKLTVLPLRLHVDQDALDFMTRFFEFKNDAADAAESSSIAESHFIQRAEVDAIRIKLDFKPKRVDYAGLRSGRTSEFMNLFVLDRAEMVLRHVILYGVSGFDRLGKSLNDIWSLDVRQNQLPGVIAGVGPVQSLMGIGGGVRDLVVVPLQEYRKDGRIFRSLHKGAHAFAKTTTSELVRLGAKLAIGTQNVLESAEEALKGTDDPSHSDVSSDWHHADLDPKDRDQISQYADQPIGVLQGLRGAYSSLERDLLTTKDAIIAMPGEIMEQGTTGGAAKAVLKTAPIIVLRPAVGITKALSQTLMGVTNTLDPTNRNNLDDKYKSH